MHSITIVRRGVERGFTIVELVVVMAIVAILGSVAVFSVIRSQNRIELDRSISDLRSEIEHVRALSRTAGSRMGTNRLQYDASCTAAAGQLLWINVISPTQVSIPTQLAYDDTTDLLTVTCTLWDFGGGTGAAGEAQILSPPAGRIFGFAANGRAAFPTGTPPVDLFFQLQHDDGAGAPHPGFRVLPAGLTCVSSEPNPPVPGVDPCDQVAL